MQPPYLELFGFRERPFSLTPDENFFFPSSSHSKCLEYLRFFVQHEEPIALVYGDVGMGKTITCRKFVRSLDASKYNTALILNPIFDRHELLKEILRELNLSNRGGFRELYTNLENFLLETHSKGKCTIIIVDEAQLLSDETLDFIRILSNFETDKGKLVHIVLFAQEEFLDRIKREDMKYLAQRITVTFRLCPLPKEEILPYINHRIYKAGLTGTFRCDQKVASAVYEYSKGNPRLINLLCDRAFLLLYLHSKYTLTVDEIREAAAEESLAHLLARPKKSRNVVRWPYLATLLLALLLYVLTRFDFLGSALSFFLSSRKAF
ncbi:MAG: AAA family ATPase [Candidatus Bathyarchaeia archaeon]